MSISENNGTKKSIENKWGIPEELVLRTILENSHDTIYFKDKNGKFLFISKAQAVGLGLSESSQAIGKTDFDFFPENHARQAFEDEQRIMKTGVPMLNKVEKLVWPDGSINWVSASKYPLYDSEGNLVGTWGSSRNITDYKMAQLELERINEQLNEANRKLELLSIVDSLSDLFNHRFFYEETSREYDRYARQKDKGISNSFSVILFDVDFFKNINDNLGHLVGDYVVRHIGALLKSTIRSTDKAFRYGGDEFVLLLPNTSKNQACEVAEKIKRLVEEAPLENNGQKFKITISVGVASSEEANSVNELLEKVDTRLYRSKEGGRNRVTFI